MLLTFFFSIIYILGLVCYKHTIHVYITEDQRLSFCVNSEKVRLSLKASSIFPMYVLFLFLVKQAGKFSTFRLLTSTMYSAWSVSVYIATAQRGRKRGAGGRPPPTF